MLSTLVQLLLRLGIGIQKPNPGPQPREDRGRDLRHQEVELSNWHKRHELPVFLLQDLFGELQLYKILR